MAGETQQKGNGGMRSWLRVVLVLSLALNLLVAGAAIGAMVTWSNWKSHHQTRLDMAGGPLTRALSRDDRRAIGRQMRQAHRSGAFSRPDMRAELAGLVADLRAQPFDPEAVGRRLARHHEAMDERFRLGQKLLLDRLSQMQPEERAAYADRLQEVMQRHGRKRRKPAEDE